MSEMHNLEISSSVSNESEKDKGLETVKLQKINIRKAGGNSSKNSQKFSIDLPAAWVKQMCITKENRTVKMLFDGKNIIISKE